MASDAELLFLCASAVNIIVNRENKRRKERRWWVRNFLSKRGSHGAYTSVMRDLKLQDRQGFKNFVRMSTTDFEVLLNMTAQYYTLKDTNFREAITPAEQLAVTLRFLATGDSYSSLMYMHRISKSKISEIIPKVCQAIIKALQREIEVPKTEAQWKQIAREFEIRWNFPHCIGALDGKHVQIVNPAHAGSTYYNYKDTFSIVLMALVDADYQFIYADVGVQGRISDGGVFNRTTFNKALQADELHIPEPEPLSGREVSTPYVIVADDAFALQEHVMKPFPGNHNKGSKERVYNYRLCRARRVIENAFGILSSVFRVLRKPIHLDPHKATIVALCTVYLHNFLRRNREARLIYSPPGSFDSENLETGTVEPGRWRDHPPLTSLLRRGRNVAEDAKQVRSEFAEYFVTAEGQVEWQHLFA